MVDSNSEGVSATQGGGSFGWLALLAVPFAALAGTGAYLHMHWAEIPARFPVHWDLRGVPNGWMSRTPLHVYGPLAIGAAVLMLIAGLMLLVRWEVRGITLQPAVLGIQVVVGWCIGAAFTMVGWLPLHYFPPQQVLGVAGVTVIAIVATVIMVVRQAGRTPSQHFESTPDSCWRGGAFYYNPQDPALLVEKRCGVGWTLNFAHRLSWVILAALLLLPVAIAVALRIMRTH